MLRTPTMTRAGRQFARGVKTEAQIAKMGLTLPSLPQPAVASLILLWPHVIL